MSGNKSMRRALETSDAARIMANAPLVQDRTILIYPDDARARLNKNKNNRPINFQKAKEYGAIMKDGKWTFHPQGIIEDQDGNIITGQTRLWGIIFAGVPILMRVSTISVPKDQITQIAQSIDRGRPQTARDLASRRTDREHSSNELAIARALAHMRGTTKPSVDCLAQILEENSKVFRALLEDLSGTKKTRGVLMILAAIIWESPDLEQMRLLVLEMNGLVKRLEDDLLPETPEKCWNKGVAFGLALKAARIRVRALKGSL